MTKPTFNPWINTAYLDLDPAVITPAEAQKDPDRLPRLLLRPVRLKDEQDATAWASANGRDAVMTLIAHLLLHVRGEWALTGRAEPVEALPQGATLELRVEWLEKTLTYREARLVNKAIWDETKITEELAGN